MKSTMSQREVISFSLPRNQAKELKKTIAREKVTLSKFLRDALAQKLRVSRWKKIRRKGALTAKKHRISPEDIEAIVDEFRQ